MRKALQKVVAITVVLLMAALGLATLTGSPAAAQDERLDARPGDYLDDAGEVDIITYLAANAASAAAPGVVPGQPLNLVVAGLSEGDIITVFIANPVQVLGRFTLDGGALVERTANSRAQGDTFEVEVTIPAAYREGYAEIIASRDADDALTDRARVVSVGQVYVTKAGAEVTTESIDLGTETEQLITLSTDALAQTGRTTLVYLGFGALLIMSGVVVLDATRNRKFGLNA